MLIINNDNGSYRQVALLLPVSVCLLIVCLLFSTISQCPCEMLHFAVLVTGIATYCLLPVLRQQVDTTWVRSKSGQLSSQPFKYTHYLIVYIYIFKQIFK